MAASEAWLLSPYAGARVAIGPGELVHLHSRGASLFPVPGAPEYCRQIMLWQGEPAPVLDLSAYLGLSQGVAQQQLLAVLAYRAEAASAPEYAGLLLASPPRRIAVREQDALGPEALDSAWVSISHSAFSFEGAAVPILDLASIFAGGERRAASLGR